MQMIDEHWGHKAWLVHEVSGVILLLSSAVFNVGLFVYLPFDEPLAATALMTANLTITSVPHAATSVSMLTPRWFVCRLSLVLTYAGCWYEAAALHFELTCMQPLVGDTMVLSEVAGTRMQTCANIPDMYAHIACPMLTHTALLQLAAITCTICRTESATDLASGVTALQDGATVFGSIICACAGLEMLVVIHHSSVALVAHTKRTLALAAVLEVPLLVITVVVLVQAIQAPGKAWLAHVVSLSQTVLSLGSNAVWLLMIAPMFFPGRTLAGHVAQVISTTLSLDDSNGEPVE